jgi:dihydrofolate reductase
MIISLIVALDRRRGIGKDNQLPWRLPADLRRFRELTMGHHLIVGRKTYESIGKPLPGRTMIVVTRQPNFQIEGCLVVDSVKAALALVESRGESEVFVIGGAEIYAQTLAQADRLYLTLVEAEVAADTFFPVFAEDDWQEVERCTHAADEKHPYAFTFVTLDKKH